MSQFCWHFEIFEAFLDLGNHFSFLMFARKVDVMNQSCTTVIHVLLIFPKVIFVPVDHHTEAYGISLCHQDGWKLTYSGDTEPCQSLVDAGMYCFHHHSLTC